MAQSSGKKKSKITFFLGKGGVGKTTVSTAYALQAASKRGRRIVLISTDPAHSLADVLEKKLRAGMQKLPRTGLGTLHVWQVDAGARFQEFLDQYRDAIAALVEQGTFLSREEIDSFLETTLPGLAEVSALLTISDLLESGKFDEIVVDTAPIGHTLQLFRIPTELARFLEFLELAGQRDQVLAQHFGGAAAAGRPKVLEEWDAVLSSLRAALSSKESKLVMVTSAEGFSLEEASRTAKMLAQDSGAAIEQVVLNRVVTRAHGCKRCQMRARLYGAANKFLTRRFPKAELLTGEDPGFPISGIGNLRAFGRHVFDGKPLKLAPTLPTLRKPRAGLENLALRRTAWPAPKTRITLTLGKGGVGKTTISGGLAYARRKAQSRTNLLICSTDPAPSLDDLFEQAITGTPKSVLNDKLFHAVEIDATAEYLAWSRKLKRTIQQSLELQQGGLHVELTFEHEMLSALLDIVPPGVDEIFAIFKLLDFIEARKLTLVIDMAPTGHALELLRTPERLVVWTRLLLKSLAAHRKLPLAQELAVEVASISQRARELVQLLQDRNETSVFIVMLPEPLPDRQTGRLLATVHDLKLQPTAVFVNRVLPVTAATGCQRCERAREWQLVTLSRLRTDSLKHYAVPEFVGQIAGQDGLQRLTHRLWEIGQTTRAKELSQLREGYGHWDAMRPFGIEFA